MSVTETRQSIEKNVTAGKTADEEIALAVSLERQAKLLRKSSPGNVDNAIVAAVSQLMIDSRECVLTPRESFEAAVDILQFTPSRVSRSAPPDKRRSLDAFDRLSEPSVPILIPDKFNGHTWTGIGLGGTPRVKISVADAMGGLPDARITFDAKQAHYRGERGGDEYILDRKARKTISLLYDLGNAAVGADSIIDLIAGQEIRSERYTCGHGPRTNEAQIAHLTQHAQLLAKISGFVLCF